MVAHNGKTFEVEVEDKKYRLYFKHPNQSELFKIDLKYKQIFSEAVKAGVMTESQTRKELLKHGAWTNEDDEKVSSVSLNIANLQAVLNALKDNKEERKGILEVINKITELRAVLIEMIANRTKMIAQSAEGIANEQRIHKFAELCLYEEETGEKFFESNDQYQRYASDYPDALSEIYKQAYMFEYDSDESNFEDFPEMKVLKQMADEEEKEAEEKRAKANKVVNKTKTKRKTKKKDS